MRDFDLITTLVVHHSASRRNVTLEGLNAWHLKRGWSGIGYHFVIEEDGEIRVGRPFRSTGAHCRKHNNYTVGVCVTGDNTIPGRKWIVAQTEGLKRLVRSLRLVIPDLKVKAHRDLAATLCPGLDIQDILKEESNA